MRPAKTRHAAPESIKPGRQRGGGIQSLERASAILDEVARHRDGIGLAELARAVGLHASTTFHLAKTLATLGYIRQSQASRVYRLGPKVFALAAGASGELELVRTATPVLEALAATTGESAHLAIDVVGGNVTVVARTAGAGAFQLVDRGGARPAYCTALGKVLLAAAAPDALERYLAEASLLPRTARTITDPDRLRQEIELVRRQGLAYDDCEFDAEVRCIAAPVRDFTGRVVAAVGLSGPVWRMNVQRLHALGADLRDAAARLSVELGFRAGGVERAA
jgi:IclR family KDG regulon transcriptional repressor